MRKSKMMQITKFDVLLWRKHYPALDGRLFKTGMTLILPSGAVGFQPIKGLVPALKPIGGEGYKEWTGMLKGTEIKCTITSGCKIAEALKSSKKTK
jgi:hypothetical protein